MKVAPGCTPCILRRLLATAQQITDDAWLHDKVLAQAMGELIDAERDVTPAERMQELFDLVCRNLGVSDPWQKVRDLWAEEVEALEAPLARKIADAEDPVDAALRASARANVFDDETLTRRKIREGLQRLGLRESVRKKPDQFAFSDLERFRTELAGAETLLFLHDSAPEALFDRFLIERLRLERPGLRVTSVVRPQPIFLDATRGDLLRYGYQTTEGIEEIIDPGVPGLGLSLEEVPKEFRERFEAADLVIAKGQAHLETLADAPRPVYFLLRFKCVVVATQQGSRIGEIAFVRGG